MIGTPDRRPLALPVYRPRHERAFGLDQLDLKLALHVRSRGGFFVEAGANDGITQSNTLYFARYRGWRGLLIEPVPELAQRCRAVRPDSVVEQVALVAPDHRGTTIGMRYSNLMTLVKGARGSEEEDVRHVTAGADLQGVATYELEAPARTLSSVLDAHGVTQVDLLVLDLEGYEPAALRGLDLDRHRPTFMLIEVWDRPAIERALSGWYDVVAELSRHDVLYRLRHARRAAGRTQPRLNAK